MEKEVKNTYHTHITAKHRWYELNLREVWAYRDLIILFTKRSFALTYKQTILGPAWIFLNPLISSIMYAVVFGGIAGIGTDGVPMMLFYLSSNAIWQFFYACMVNNAKTFTENAGVFGKVYFPRLTTPISNMLSAMIRFFVQMLLVFGVMAYYLWKGQVSPKWYLWPAVLLVLIHIGLLGLGCGIIISSLTTKYRDLSVLVDFGAQLWMYATPIVYPLSMMEDGLLRTLILINPVSAPVEFFRYAFLGQGMVMPGYLALSWGITIFVVLIGVLIFNRVEKTFMDTV